MLLENKTMYVYALMVVLLLAFRFLLDLTYIVFISEYFRYSGFYYDFNKYTYLLSWFFTFISIFLVREKIDKPSDYFFLTVVVFVLIPLTSYFGLADRELMPLLISVLSVYFIYIILNTRLVKPVNFKKINNGHRFAFFVSIVFVVILIFWYILSGAIKYMNFDFTRVYEFRSKSAELAAIGPMAYLNGWVYNVFIVYYLSYCLLNKKYNLFLLGFLIQIFFYGVSGHKSVFFTPFLVLGIWWYFSKYKSIIFMIVFFNFLLIVGFVFLSFDNIEFSSMFVRRLFFVPAKLYYDYIDFFSVNPKVYWSNSFLSFFFDYPYAVKFSMMVGEANDTGSNANNGYMSSGYANWGYYGIFFYSIIISFILKNIDYYAKSNLPLWFVLALVIVPLRAFIVSSDLFTTILTHGLLVAMILLVISRK
ncbi:O-antigen polymerase [Acinetobacter sp. YH12075]|uniref:O-antigen polymerase n=1 Tax=Acinetobacter sp. YH12075 TaxID=2601070 RepID=UPI0015D202E5|nr:O-antigen polymerase [Acinetobacter sp. YH12075]